MTMIFARILNFSETHPPTIIKPATQSSSKTDWDSKQIISVLSCNVSLGPACVGGPEHNKQGQPDEIKLMSEECWSLVWSPQIRNN